MEPCLHDTPPHDRDVKNPEDHEKQTDNVTWTAHTQEYDDPSWYRSADEIAAFLKVLQNCWHNWHG